MADERIRSTVDPVVRLSEERVLLSTLRTFARATELAATDPDWLPVTFAMLHDAMRHAAVIALQGTSGVGVLKPLPARKRKHHDVAHPEDYSDRLLSDEELYERTHDGIYMTGWEGARPAPRDHSTDFAFENTKFHRDELTHYKPNKSWSILLGGVPANYRLLLGRVEFLLFEAGMTHLFEPAPDEFRTALRDAEVAVEKLEAGLAMVPGPYHPPL